MSIHNQVIFATEQQVKGLGFTIRAPISGKVASLAQHPKNLFSYGALGCGAMIELSSHKIVAPFDGIVEQVKHGGTEIYLKATNGIKLIISVDIDSEYLPLPGLAIKKLPQQKFSLGETLIYFDLRKIPSPIYAAITILNHKKLGAIYYSQHHVTAAEDILFTVTAKKKAN